MKPGDIAFFRRKGLVSRIIQFAQYLQYGKKYQPYTYWTHCAIVVDEKGTIVEAAAKGLRYSTVQPEPHAIYIWDCEASDEDRQRIVDFAESCVGEQYGWLDIFSIGIGLLTKGKVIIGLDGTEICSSICARALEHANLLYFNKKVFHRQTCIVKPADLAMMLNIPTTALSESIQMNKR